MQQRGDVGKARADLDAALEKFTNLEIEIQEEVENIKTNGLLPNSQTTGSRLFRLR